MKNIKYFKYFFDYMRDGDYPFFEKFLILAALAYIVIPADIIPDFLLPVGILDDSLMLGGVVVWGGKLLKGYFEHTVKKRTAELAAKNRLNNGNKATDIEEDW